MYWNINCLNESKTEKISIGNLTRISYRVYNEKRNGRTIDTNKQNKQASLWCVQHYNNQAEYILYISLTFVDDGEIKLNLI